MYRMSIILLLSSPLLAQIDDLTGQIELINDLLPNATTVGIIWNPQNAPGLESEFAQASAETGFRVIQTPMRNIREISGLMKALSPYNVSFIYLVEDRLVTGKNAIKFIAKASKKRDIPVFSTAEDVLESGGLGRLVKSPEGDWTLRLNPEVAEEFSIQIPQDNDKIVVGP